MQLPAAALFAAQVQVFLIQHSMHCGRGDPSRIPLHRRPSSSLASSSICERQENESNFSLQSPLSDKLGQQCASWPHPQIQNVENLRYLFLLFLLAPDGCSRVADEDSDGDNFRLRHHGDHGGGAEEGGGQAEGPHPLTGGHMC